MQIVEFVSYLLLPLLLLVIVFYGMTKKISVYDNFIDGTKEGFSVILKIFPTMLSVILAINLFKISGTMDLLIKIITPMSSLIKIPSEIIPIGMMRSISGGGAVAILSDILKTNGPDSTIGRIASTIMGSSDTTLYVLAVYTSVIKIEKTKGALWIGLLCDLVAVLLAVHFWSFC